MSTWEDINPDFITNLPVSKQEMRNQLQHIKNVLQTLQQGQGWNVLSTQYVAVPTGAVAVQLPDGWLRYRVEFQDVNCAADFSLVARLSEDGGTTTISTTTTYLGSIHEFNSTGNTQFAAKTGDDTAVNITGTQLALQQGAFGHLEFVYQRNYFTWESNYITTGGAFNKRRGVCQCTTGDETNAIVFFPYGQTTTFTAGTMFKVLVHV